MVGRKGILVDFLPKLLAEIRQKVFLCLSGLSVFLQKGSLSAERLSFGRKAPLLAERLTFGRKLPFLLAFWWTFCRNFKQKFGRKILFLPKEGLLAEITSFGYFGISAET